MAERLTDAEIQDATAAWPDDARALARAVRDLVLDLAPQLDETIAFGAPAYVKSGSPYGVVGGHVCQLEAKGGALRLAFLHGASLEDPEGLLQGTAKAKRYVELATPADVKRPAVLALLRAAVAHDPAGGEVSR